MFRLPCRAGQGGPPAFRFFERSTLERQPCRHQPKSDEEVRRIAEGRYQPENARSFYTSEQRRGLREADVEMET